MQMKLKQKYFNTLYPRDGRPVWDLRGLSIHITMMNEIFFQLFLFKKEAGVEVIGGLRVGKNLKLQRK